MSAARLALLELVVCTGCMAVQSPVTAPAPAETPVAPDASAAAPSPAAVPASPAPSDEREAVPVPSRYVFPLDPAEAATYGATHHDYPATDIFAPCGSPVVAVTSSRVSELSRTDAWDPSTNDGATRGGLFVSIVGDDGVRYYGSHLSSVTAGLAPGVRVRSGEQVGTVGDSGNTAGTDCHLHFGMSPTCGVGDWKIRRGVVAPAPCLDRLRASDSGASPAGEVEVWRVAHSDQCRTSTQPS